MIWKPIPGLAGFSASEHGDIRREKIGLNGRRPRVLGQTLESTGYKSVSISPGDGTQAQMSAHRLVCLAFHGLPPTPEHQVAHRDGTRTNNAALNLRWATPVENAADRRAHGRDRFGADVPTARLRDDHIRLIFGLAAAGTQQREIASLFGVHQASVYRALHRMTWKHVSLPDGISYDPKRFCRNGHLMHGENVRVHARGVACATCQQGRYRRFAEARA
jgi:hypothetical protein